MKLAVTILLAVRLTLHAVPAAGAVLETVAVETTGVQPLQPAKVDPVAGAAVSVIVVPLANTALQAVPQLIPTGLLATVPEPAPDLETVSV